jgi:hypothetical protein
MSNLSGHDPSRRKFIKKIAYVPPAILTLSAVPSYATTGSPRNNHDDDNHHHKGGNKHSNDSRKSRHGWFHNIVESVKKEVKRH